MNNSGQAQGLTATQRNHCNRTRPDGTDGAHGTSTRTRLCQLSNLGQVRTESNRGGKECPAGLSERSELNGRGIDDSAAQNQLQQLIQIGGLAEVLIESGGHG